MIATCSLLPPEDLDFDCEGIDRPPRILDCRRRGRLADRHLGAGRVEQAHALVGQLPAGDEPPREFHGLHHRLVEHRHLVVLFERLDHAAEHPAGHLVGRLLHLHHLKPPGQSRVLLEVFLVFGPGRGGDGPQLTAGERRLEHVGSIPLPRLAAGTDERVGLVDEENDRGWRLLHLVDHAFEPVLEFTLHARARLQQAQVERAERDILQRLRHIAVGDPLGESFDHGRFADARLAGEDRVVLPPSREDVDDLPHLGLAAPHRIDLARLRAAGEIDRVLIEVRRLGRPTRLAIGPCGCIAARRVARGRAAGHEVGLGRSRKHARCLAAEHVGRDPAKLIRGGKQPLGERLVGEQRHEQPRAANLLVAEVDAGDQPGLLDEVADLGREQRRPGVAGLEAVDRLREVGEHPALIDVEMLEEQADVVAGLLQELREPVLDLDVVVRSRETQAGGSFERPLADGVQLPDESLEIESGHARGPLRVPHARSGRWWSGNPSCGGGTIPAPRADRNHPPPIIRSSHIVRPRPAWHHPPETASELPPATATVGPGVSSTRLLSTAIAAS